MSAQNDNTTPPRTGARRLISPWEYRHLSVFARVRVASGFFVAGFGLCPLVLSFGWTPLAEQRTTCFWFAALMVAIAAACTSFGYWEMTIARSAAPRT